MIKMTSITLKRNIPHIYDYLYKKHGEKQFNVKIDKIDEKTFYIRQIPFKDGIVCKNEFPSNYVRLLPLQTDFLNNKFN